MIEQKHGKNFKFIIIFKNNSRIMFDLLNKFNGERNVDYS